MKLKKVLLAFPLQLPLMLTLVFAVRFLTDLNVWWCILITSSLVLLYDVGETILRGE